MRCFNFTTPVRLLRIPLRFASTSSPPVKPPPRPVEATTFSSPSVPQEVYDRPEPIRGLPPISKISPSPFSTNSAAAAEPGSSLVPGSPTNKFAVAALENPHRFEGPARPRLLFNSQQRELPKTGGRWPKYLLMILAGGGFWVGFVLYATNAERLASSVFRSVIFHLRNSPDVVNALGSRVKLEEPQWGFGDPWISGSVNTMQGRVDLSFRVKGDREHGTVYFTSIRPSQQEPWRIVRYKLISDSGETLRLEDKIEKL